MYKIKRLLLIILSVSMVFSASCNTKREPEEIQISEISYKQTVLGQQSGMKCTGKLCVAPDNKLVVCDYSTSKPKYFIFDASGTLINSFESDFEGDGNAFTVDKNSRLYILAQKLMKDANDKIYERLLDIYIYDLEGNLESTIPLGRIPINEENTALITEIEIDEKNIYALVKGQRIEVFDSSGSIKDTIVSRNSKSMCLDGRGGLIIAEKDSNVPNIKKINLENKNKAWTIDAKSDIQRIRFSDSIYALDNSGITRYYTDGKIRELLFDLDKYPVSQGIIADFAMDTQGAIYFSILGGSEIYKFIPADANEVNEEKTPTASVQNGEIEEKTLTVSVDNKYDINALRNAVPLFKKTHPNFNVKFVNQSEFDKDGSDYSNIITTQIMAGNAPDIIGITAYIPYMKMLDKKTFVNLSEIMDKDNSLNINDLYKNIIDAGKYKGNLYAMPVTVYFRTLSANAGFLNENSISIDDSSWTWNDFLTLAETLAEGMRKGEMSCSYPIAVEEWYSLYATPFLNSYNHFIDIEEKVSNFKSGEFSELLNFAKSANEKDLVYYTGENPAKADAVFCQSMLGLKASLDAKKDLNCKNIIFLNYPSSRNIEGTTCVWNIALAINKDSPYKDEAWSFIKATLDENVQFSMISYVDFVNLPTNKKAFEKATEDVLRMYSGIITENDISMIRDFITKCAHVSIAERHMWRNIRKEMEKYFLGERSIDETVQVIDNMVNIYLME